MEGEDESGREYKKRRNQWKKWSENCKRKHCSSLNHICNHFQLIYTKTYLIGLYRGQIYLDNSNLFLFDYLLNFILTVISFIRAYFSNPLSSNSLYLAFWVWIRSYLRSRIQNVSLQYIYELGLSYTFFKPLDLSRSND